MMTNNDFLEVIKDSFLTYLQVGTSKSPAKLKTLHGHIAKDLEEKFGSSFTVHSQGYGDDKEGSIQGRYYLKKVDITINKNGKAVAGYAVKFVMRNYSQNSNNYFENMLGETANIRSTGIPYFQVFIIFDKVPYYKSGGYFKKYDTISAHNLEKYLALSKDDPSVFFHTPDKTLVILIKLKECAPFYRFLNDKDYAAHYKSVISDADLFTYASLAGDPFDDNVIYNDYEDFIDRSYHVTLGRLKK